MIGPGNSGNEGFARRLNRRQWMEENPDRKLTETEEMAFTAVFCTMIGMIATIGVLQGMQAIDGMSR